MKFYFTLIARTQKSLLFISILMLLFLPPALSFFPETFTAGFTTFMYALAHLFLVFVMSVRPLADLIPFTKWLRPLVILRKGAGVFSASIIMSFIFSKIIVDPSGFFSAFGTSAYWSLSSYALYAHLADISAFLLLITSNNLSKRLLGKGWKRIQRLSYVYFFGSSIYLYLSFHQSEMLNYMGFVATITLLAFIKNRLKNN